jgi:uncharacterized protein YbcC (UPF0753/DUF2309 family)
MMNVKDRIETISLREEQREAAEKACARIAPTWPLDQMIAVNPWWGMRDTSFKKVSAKLSTLARVRCLMPKSYYAQQWGRDISESHLMTAAEQVGEQVTIEALMDYLEAPEWQTHWHNFSDLLDSHLGRENKMAWRDEIAHQISQFCAGYFQLGSPFNHSADATEGLYRDWLDATRQDKGIEILMAERGLSQQFEMLPNSHEELLALAIEEMGAQASLLEDYFHALLLDINGWASWAAYGKWQADLNGKPGYQQQEELLCVRVAWELALWRHARVRYPKEMTILKKHWAHQWEVLPRLVRAHLEEQRLGWVWQWAIELAYQGTLNRTLQGDAPSQSDHAPLLQAAFCIDVRSEPMRRALEQQDARIQTIGFAGFFGLPIEYVRSGTGLNRPQLPGLLKAGISVSEIDAHACSSNQALNNKVRWNAAKEASPSTFSLVEAVGLGSAYKLIKDTFFPGDTGHPHNQFSAATKWLLKKDDAVITAKEKAALVAGVIKAMGFQTYFAPTVMLIGHGSVTRNNPHAAGLDCGACCGQTGEVNVRVLSSLLNELDVREELSILGIDIPAETTFIAALHNTTTDEISILDRDESHVDAEVLQWLEDAGKAVRRERSISLGLDSEMDSSALELSVRKRSKDWSQVRPEWGLANNACFIVAPRSRTRGLDLKGRSFLHDYDWVKDDGFGILELIMTAPMVVTNWINMQYNASVTDNLKYGSGNKVLHNVVGGNLGVFEGNGGDLRIGLSLQSVHDGKRWMHQPLRLSVYIDAPQNEISAILERHKTVSDLVNNDWLFLFHWDRVSGDISRYAGGDWLPVSDPQLSEGAV